MLDISHPRRFTEPLYDSVVVQHDKNRILAHFRDKIPKALRQI